MTTLFPGAIWKPIPGSASRPARSKGRAVIFHVAVSEGASLYNTFVASGNDSHLYVRRDGTLEQYIDLDRVAYASVTANASTISVETQGGVTNPDGEPWTPQQVATLAAIARWAHNTEGVPLQLMPNSLRASKGIGYHRLGINPWRVSGGEVWSSSAGKLCPGAAKIAQVPAIIAAAIGGAPTPEDDDMPQFQNGCVMPGESGCTIVLPPVGAPGKPAGIAGWGPAWLTVRADSFGALTGPCTARIGVLHSDGTWRPLAGPSMDVTLKAGDLGLTVQLQAGDVGFVLTPTGEFPVGWCVEYAKP